MTPETVISRGKSLAQPISWRISREREVRGFVFRHKPLPHPKKVGRQMFESMGRYLIAKVKLTHRDGSGSQATIELPALILTG